MRAMSRITVAAAVVLFATVGSKTALYADAARSGSVARQDLPDGPGKAELSKICSGCHDLMFTVSTRETEEGWTSIVNDMRSKGADGTDAEFAKIIAYLTEHMGKK